MRKSFRKAIALLLTVATMTGFMALGVNATATYKTISQTAGNKGTSNTAYMTGYMQYHYDTANLNILTKVAAYSEYIGVGTYNITVGNQTVYLYNEVTAKYTVYDDEITAHSQSQRFSPSGTVRYTDNELYDSPLKLNAGYRTEYAVSKHWLRISSTDSVWQVSNIWE